MVFRNILVALDCSPQAPVVFEHSLELAKKMKESRIILCHTLRSETEELTSSYIGTLADVDIYGTFQRLHHTKRQKEIEQAQSWLETYLQQATAQTIPAEFDCCEGNPGVEICNLAHNWGADLIIIGRRGHKGLSEIFLGSVSNYVVHHAPCSVLVVQDRKSSAEDTLAANNR